MRISRDTPCYYLTSVAKDRLPVFQTDVIKQIVCNALDEARASARHYDLCLRIHQNPVRAGLVERAEDYRFSSARLWRGGLVGDESFITDHKQIDWRAA